jgi:hypothetical protein
VFFSDKICVIEKVDLSKMELSGKAQGKWGQTLFID